ncbi:glycosyltransferase family 4 protein [Bradyrhizobium sp. dw_78]|uniref:glycosyltransferase family 4 protein n=1 Tax=Bradyrhizobium sp. dw_78 TaxID=2719793 RepID=UPI001BD2006B|nr:glycosyltransferase family 4 protein [Bradyrhizobium sp. dw_78]
MRNIVAILALPPPTHGQAVVNQAMVDALAAAGASLRVVNTSPGALRKGLSYHARRMSLHLLKAVPALLGARGGLVYSVVEPGAGMAYNFLILLLARLRGLRIVLHHHSALYTRTFDPRFDWLSRIAGRDALHVALDEFMARDLKANYPSLAHITVALNASYVDDPAREERSERPLTCGFMSNLSREKGLDTFLDCLRSARKAGLDLRAILAGPAASREAEKMVADAQAEFGDGLTVLGPVSGTSKQEFFRSIDVFLFPSRYRVEGQPLVILEAMSYGVPVVASRQGYCAELVGDAGASAPISEFETVASEFLIRCYNDTKYRQAIGAAARARFEMLKREADIQKSDLVSEICSSGEHQLANA